MSDTYGFLAPIYQPISRLIFGKDLIAANQTFLDGKANEKVLIIGGGDGLAYRDKAGALMGEYWDTSFEMIQLAKKNLKQSGLKIQVGFWPGTGKFDRIYFPFVLDTMRDDEISTLLNSVRFALLSEGKVVISDFFETVSFSQRIIQVGMIGFFRLFTSHRRKDLPDLNSLLVKSGFELIEEKSWRKGWIRSQLWGAN